MAFRQEYSALSDEELVQLFQSGERHAAFTAIVDRYQRQLYFAAKRLLNGDHDEADEITQDTFVKAYEALAKFRSEAKLYTWLYRILMNGVIQKSRKGKKRQMVDINDIAYKVEAEEGSPQDKIERQETTKLIEKAIESLPPKQQQVFMMRFYDEMPYEDIAEIVGTSVGGLKANYFHAVKKIGEYLHEKGKVAPEFLTALNKS